MKIPSMGPKTSRKRSPRKQWMSLMILVVLAVVIIRYFWQLSTFLKSVTDSTYQQLLSQESSSSSSSSTTETTNAVGINQSAVTMKTLKVTASNAATTTTTSTYDPLPPIKISKENPHLRENIKLFIDDKRPHYRPLMNRFLVEKYLHNNNNNNNDFDNSTGSSLATILQSGQQQQIIPPHGMDVVIMASAPDPALAISIHNLYHLMGFRRFIFVVNNATEHCSIVMDLVPQHNNNRNDYDDAVPPHSSSSSSSTQLLPRPHICLDHWSFYSSIEISKMQQKNNYPQIYHGPPGKNKRGKKYVNVGRMGWYLQQFSKLLIYQVIPNLSQQYLVIDGDIIFTRPYNFFSQQGQGQDGNNKIIMPISNKSPQQWRYFVNLLFGNDYRDDDDKNNYVVGWMIFDQTIVHDMITHINQRRPDNTNDKFPLNILNIAETVIKNSTYFSEFYTYARFAIRHPLNSYIPTKIPEPARNPGNFQYTCILRKSTYQNAQKNLNVASFMIWEEHKQHAYQACPNRESIKTTTLQNIGIWHDFMPPPWGGGNQFLLALRHGLDTTGTLSSRGAATTTSTIGMGVKVIGKNDPDGKEMIRNSSNVILANSITFRGETTILDQLKNRSKLALVHRVDGPYYVARYFRTLNFTGTLKSKHLPIEDKKTKQFNKNYACATIFQSQWSLQSNLKIGLTLRNPVIIPNTVDPEIFYPLPRPQPTTEPPPSHRQVKDGQRKLVIVASSHSNNQRKGFDTMLWLDAHLDYNRFEFVYIGGRPSRPGLFDLPSNSKMQLVPPGNSTSVADILRKGDIYLACSRYEPASNAVMEALACGLPVLYQRGSSHGDLAGKAGVGFDGVHDLLQALNQLVDHYDDHVRNIFVPDIHEVSKKYLSIMRWCFYMKHVLVLESGY